jgi:hypothetical protein
VEYSAKQIANEVKQEIERVKSELMTKRYQLFATLMTALTERMPFCPTGLIKSELEQQLVALIGQRTDADKLPPKQTQPSKKKVTPPFTSSLFCIHSLKPIQIHSFTLIHSFFKPIQTVTKSLNCCVDRLKRKRTMKSN